MSLRLELAFCRPADIGALEAQLHTGTRAERLSAVRDLRACEATSTLIEHLGHRRRDVHNAIREALLDLGFAAVDPLFDALPRASARLQNSVLSLIAELAAQCPSQVLPRLRRTALLGDVVARRHCLRLVAELDLAGPDSLRLYTQLLHHPYRPHARAALALLEKAGRRANEIEGHQLAHVA